MRTPDAEMVRTGCVYRLELMPPVYVRPRRWTTGVTHVDALEIHTYNKQGGLVREQGQARFESKPCATKPPEEPTATCGGRAGVQGIGISWLARSGTSVITGLPALYPRWDLRGWSPGRGEMSMWSPAVGKRQHPGIGCVACRELKLQWRDAA